MRGLSSVARRWKNRLAVRILVRVLAVSTLLSLLATSLQLYAMFQRQDATLQQVTGQIEQGFGKSLGSALRPFDQPRIDQILDGIFASADIGALTLTTENGQVLTRGPKDADEALQTGDVELLQSDPERGERVVGTLAIGLSQARIWSDIYAQALVVFLSNLAKTGIASVAILLIFRRLVSRHLRTISSHLSKPDWIAAGGALALDRPPRGSEDDLDAITSAINETRNRSGDVDRDEAETFEQVRLVLDTTVNGIIGLDGKGMVTVINTAARDMLGGYAGATPFPWPEEIKFQDVIDLQPLDASLDPINRALVGQTLQAETHALVRKGQIDQRYVRVSSALVTKERSNLACVIVLDDVSQLEKNRQQIERKGRLDALRELTGGIAHDFNNLLATILYAMQLTRQDDISERSDRLLETALGAVDRGRTLTGRLLAFAKRQPGVARSRRVSEIFNDFEAIARAAIEADVAVTIEPPDPDVLVHCDQSQLDNALLNLVINSRDAILRSGKGRRITVKARPLDELGSNQRVRRQDPFAYIAEGMRQAQARDVARQDTRTYRYVEIAVTDDGPGMSDEVKTRALDPFFTTKTTASRSGLGLSTVYGFIQTSDGELRIYSELGFGSTVRMILPRGTEENEREEPITSLPTRRGDGQTVLVVEDEPRLLHVMELLLEELGFQFLSARSGQAALRMLETDAKVDVILTDIVMPEGIGGFELARQARALRPRLPVVYMSGYTGFSTSEMGDVVGPMLQKPCPPAQLAEALLAALEGQCAAAEK